MILQHSHFVSTKPWNVFNFAQILNQPRLKSPLFSINPSIAILRMLDNHCQAIILTMPMHLMSEFKDHPVLLPIKRTKLVTTHTPVLRLFLSTKGNPSPFLVIDRALKEL